MQILGDSNATLKDLTRVMEAELAETGDPIYPVICTDVESADEAYIKIPIQTRVDFPTAFDGERESTSTEVAVIATYNKATYSLTLDYNADLMTESKAYSFADRTADAATSMKIFPSWNLTKNIIVANINAYDGKAFYANNHLWANTGANTINNIVAATGQTPALLYADLQTAVARMRTFLDDKGHLLNPYVAYGADQLVIQCPVALEIGFRQVVFGSLIPQKAATGDSAGAGVTAPKDLGLKGIATILPDPYLDAASPTTWYLHYVGARQRPFVYTESYGIRTAALGFGTEFHTNTNKVRIVGQHRFVEGTYRFDRSIRVA